jgi:hypothetical protein
VAEGIDSAGAGVLAWVSTLLVESWPLIVVLSKP